MSTVILILLFIGCKQPADPPVPTLTSITLNHASVKKAYAQGETLDLTGLVVTANYSDGSSTTVANYTTNPADGATLSTIGDTTIKISYTERKITRSNNFTVNVIDVTAITISNEPDKQIYKTGEPLDLTGLEVTAIYGDNTVGIAPIIASHITGFDTATAGNKTLTITYGGKTATFTVTVIALAGIKITCLPDKTVYRIGEELDITGIEVTATYSDNSTEMAAVTTVNIAGFNSATAGQKTLYAVVGDKAASFTVTVIALTGIEITRLPDKTVYRIGEELDITGIEVTATYSDNSTETAAVIAANIAGFNSATAGQKTLYVVVGDKTASFTVTVIKLTEIVVTRLPDKTYYAIGEQLDITGIEVIARYSDYLSYYSTEIVTVTEANITGFNSITAGEKTLTIAYSGSTATFTVGVLNSDDNMTVTNTNEWNTARTAISNGGNYRAYTITINGDVPIAGSTAATFGSASYISVTLKGSGKLYLNSTGNMIRLDANQTLIIDSEDLTLQGLSSNNTSLVYVIGTNTKLELRNGIITGNTTLSSGYFPSTSTGGGGVYVSGGTFTMSGGEISGNTSEYGGNSYSCGGGVYVSGTFTMSGGKISGNTSEDGGNSFSGGGGVYVIGTFTMSGGEISGNTASSHGGGVCVLIGTFTMSGGKISSNTVSRSHGSGSGGGGVYVFGGDKNAPGSFIMNGGEISGNIVGSNSYYGSGGGVYMDGGPFTMNGGEIFGNTSGYAGGGVYVERNATFTMNNGEISSNTVTISISNSNSLFAAEAYGYGGGVYVDYGTFTMNGGEISSNTVTSSASDSNREAFAYSYGGGVSIRGGNAIFTMNNGEISNNTVTSSASGSFYSGTAAYSYGGGVSVSNSTTFTMNGGVISSNTVTSSASSFASGNFEAYAYGGGVYVTGYTTYDGIIYNATFRIVTGTVYGSNVGSLSNTVSAISSSNTSGAAVYVDSEGTAEHGTFSGEMWNSVGSLDTTNDTIEVVNGTLQ